MSTQPHILVVGGAGYIGSHMVKAIGRRGWRVTTFDNLSRGHRDAVLVGDFVRGDILDPSALKQLFQARSFDAVMHFAAFAYVHESVAAPDRYYRNNVVGTLNLVDAMRTAGVRRLVFSSSCAVYGDVDGVVDEAAPRAPVSPYGRSKRMVEEILADHAGAFALDSVSLRYFNVAGAGSDGELAERHDPEPHVIPCVLKVARRIRDGARDSGARFQIFGTDYPTEDGTCVRDYVHVEDLCRAHLAAAERLLETPGAGAEAFNLGTGIGYSVRQILDACRRVTGVDIPAEEAPRRPGDATRAVASAQRARDTLAWTPELTLDDIIDTAWRTLPGTE